MILENYDEVILDWALLNEKDKDEDVLIERNEMIEDKIPNLLPNGGMCEGFDYINCYW